MRKIFIIAGEASGDLHGSNLVKALFKEDPKIEIRAYGGPKIAAAGASVVRSYEDFAFMGFYEVAKNIRNVLSNLSATKRLITDFSPDDVIFIDFPSFNLRVAKHLKSNVPAAKLHYYISPKVWAWKSARVHTLDRLMDRIYVIFPFEAAFYANYGYEVTYVGNPLMDEISERPSVVKNQGLTAVLPGSRRQEITSMLPVFAKLADKMPSQHFEVSVMDYFPISLYQETTGPARSNLTFSSRSTYALLAEAGSALVTSGTATLETALLDTPQIVAYKTSRLSFWIGKLVVKLKYISLVNIILNREAVTELLQENLTVENLQKELSCLLNDNSGIINEYAELRTLLGKTGASERVAREVLQLA